MCRATRSGVALVADIERLEGCESVGAGALGDVLWEVGETGVLGGDDKEASGHALCDGCVQYC